MRIRFNSSLLLILCLLLQSCSMSFNNWGMTSRGPAAEASFDDLVNSMKEFKARVMGSEKDATCTKEQLDEDFKKMMASLKKDSCPVSNWTLDREEFNQRTCPKVKTAGYFDKVVKVTIQEEKAKKPLTFFQNRVDPEFIAFTKEAQKHLKVVSDIIHNESYPAMGRAALITEYVENVLLPVRDVVIVMRSYLPKEDDGKVFYESLQLYLTDVFLKQLDPYGIGVITKGLNPQSSPFYLELSPLNNGTTRLVFSPTEIIKRDVLTLLKAPTAKNYVMALKWMTLHMMLSQVYLYQILLGNKDDVVIPNSCQSHFNGNLPPRFKFSYEDGTGDQFLESIITSHGLSPKEGDDTYYDYYLENINRNPTKEGYSGLIPFENYKNALQSLSGLTSGLALEPHFDDVNHFESVISFKMSQAQKYFRGRIKGQVVNYAGLDIFQKMMGEFGSDDTADIKISKDKTLQIYSGKLNLSPLLLELMQANGFTDYSQLITEKMKKKFVGRRVKIDFPSMYSSPAWRDWSLKVLADVAYKYKDAPANSSIAAISRRGCLMVTKKISEMNKICGDNVHDNKIMSNLSDYLAEFRSGEKYIPSKRLEEGKFQEVYPFLGYLWMSFRDQLHLIPDAEAFELNFLLEQMAAGNPWARLKFSYMVALDQLEYQVDGLLPKYDGRNPYYRGNDEVLCKMGNISVIYNNIAQAGKVFGLDKPLSYNHAGKILSSKEKKEVWITIVDDIQNRNAQLFSVKDGNQTYYQKAENISYKTLLTEEVALNTGVPLSHKAKDEIKQVTESSSTEVANFFLQLYNMKDPAKQQKLYEEFSKVNGIDNTFSVKLAFLALDDAYKKPIYKDLLKQAAETRKLQIMGKLDRFCKMSLDDQVEFKNLFYSTTKSQNDLNKMAGLPSVPPDVLEKVNEMTDSEWRDMWLGLGAGLAGMAAVAIGGTCTVVSGGLCAPLGGYMTAVGASMAVVGVSALGVQTKVVLNEFERHDQASASAKEIKLMEDLGFSNAGSSDEVDRTYVWAALEVANIFPIFQVVSRSINLGPKLAAVGAREIMRKSGRQAFKMAAISVTHGEQVRSAQYLLGAASVSKNLGIDAKTIGSASERIGKIKSLYISGEIGFDEMVSRVGKILDPIKRMKLAIAKTVRGEIGKVTIKQTPEQINKLASEMIANFFADNPKDMLRFVQGYTGERLNNAVRVMSEIKAVDRVGKIPVFSSMKEWGLKLRNESLAKNASKLLRIEKELAELGSGPNKLESFVMKNIDDITDIFIDVPFNKIEVPYFIFVQGMPEFNFIKGRRIPILSGMSQGQSIKKIVMARSRLVEESLNGLSRMALKLKRHVHTETTYDAFNAFQAIIADLATRQGTQEGAKTIAEYRKLENAIAKKLYAQFTDKTKLEYKSFNEMILSQSKSTKKAEFDTFKELIFNPKNLQQQGQAKAIWESVPAQELMGIKEMSEFAHRVVQQLAKYNDIDSYERYLAALKVLIISRNSAVLDIY